jgi:hypothetical protein
MSQFYVTYPPEVEGYRQFLLGLVADLKREAEQSAAKARNGYELIRINRKLIDNMQPYIDELSRVAVAHAQLSVIDFVSTISQQPRSLRKGER